MTEQDWRQLISEQVRDVFSNSQFASYQNANIEGVIVGRIVTRILQIEEKRRQMQGHDLWEAIKPAIMPLLPSNAPIDKEARIICAAVMKIVEDKQGGIT